MEIAQTIANSVLDNVRKVIVGKDNEIRLTLVALLCEGHLLIEDVPGVGKTMLARAISSASAATSDEFSSRPTCCPVTSLASDLQPEDHGVRIPPGPDHGADRAGR